MADGQMAKALREALNAADVPKRDTAAVQLARRYAQLLDEARNKDGESTVYDALGPKLLAVLTSLGLTLAGRPQKGGVAGGGTSGRSKLDELQTRRQQLGGAGEH